jgi:hypothetical protein
MEASREIAQVPMYWANDVKALCRSTFLLPVGLNRRVEAEADAGD